MQRGPRGRSGRPSSGRPRARRGGWTVSLAAFLVASCGYGFSQRYVARGGAERVEVRPFENLSTEPELGAALTTALRAELARRGAGAGEGGRAVIEGEVRAGEPSPTSTRTTATAGGSTLTAVSTWRIAVEVRARLLADGAKVAEHAVRREADFLGGADPLETEGQRALALRRAVDDAAREILRAFER